MLDVQHSKFGFTKGCIIAVIWLSLSRTFNRGQLNLDGFEFWQPTSQLLALDVCLCDAFSENRFQAKVFKSYWETIGYEANKRLKGTANAWRFQSQ
ncbi:DUF645 family protein [Vibrio cholerae]|nr:DUF645 family protein [Vibrio cholerae]